MVGAGTAHRLLRTFLELRKACEKASLSLTSDSDGNLNISLKVKVSGHGNQAPRRGGCQPRRQEVEPGTLAPSPATPAATPAAPPAPPAATAPAPARRVRRRGPGALLRDERRDWLESSRESLHRRPRSRADPPSLLHPCYSSSSSSYSYSPCPCQKGQAPWSRSQAPRRAKETGSNRAGSP